MSCLDGVTKPWRYWAILLPTRHDNSIGAGDGGKICVNHQAITSRGGHSQVMVDRTRLDCVSRDAVRRAIIAKHQSWHSQMKGLMPSKANTTIFGNIMAQSYRLMSCGSMVFRPHHHLP